MRTRRSFCLAFGALAALSACNTTPEKQDAQTAAVKKKPTESIPDQSEDVAFQAFLSHLRKAAAEHDATELASLMTTNFGYRLDPPGEGAGVFEYWDQNNVWPELVLVLNERFVPNGSFMVAPREFVTDSEHFTGYRAGLQLVNGSWKFAYFVSG